MADTDAVPPLLLRLLKAQQWKIIEEYTLSFLVCVMEEVLTVLSCTCPRRMSVMPESHTMG